MSSKNKKPKAKCPRCSECIGCDHHWMNNSDFGNDPADSEDPVNVTHVCKHCEATGSECERCEGTGEDVIDGDFGVECPDCKGSGVVEGATVDLDW